MVLMCGLLITGANSQFLYSRSSNAWSLKLLTSVVAMLAIAFCSNQEESLLKPGWEQYLLKKPSQDSFWSFSKLHQPKLNFQISLPSKKRKAHGDDRRYFGNGWMTKNISKVIKDTGYARPFLETLIAMIRPLLGSHFKIFEFCGSDRVLLKM
jgi:hypothetical protein